MKKEVINKISNQTGHDLCFHYDDAEGTLFIFPGPRYMGENGMDGLDAGEMLDLHNEDRFILTSEDKLHKKEA